MDLSVVPHISLDNVSLEYTVYDSGERSLKKKVFNFTVGGKISKDNKGNTKVIALSNVSLRINEGDRVALIGHNGAGKSTLLRVMSGVYTVNSGVVEVEGNISTLFQVDLGFDPSATGFENIMLRGLVLGFTKREIEGQIEQISELSELGPFLKMPVRTYSEGMRMRLAFAVSTNIRPELLLMDEWINAGDEQFFNIVERKVKDLIDSSNILVLATHNLKMASDLCDKAALLNRGEIVAYGPVDEVINTYRNI